MFKSVLLCGLALISAVNADVYLAVPRGSNNRLNEQSAARNNGNRLFDSQNNNRGGVNVGDKSQNAFDAADPEYATPAQVYSQTDAATATKQYQEAFFEESELTVEWTNQHGCGGSEGGDPHKTNCNIVLQYMCDIDAADPAMDVALRNGGNTNTPTEPNTYAEATADAGDDDTGRQESKVWYYECKKRRRNYGLFTADQNLNGDSAKYTRQNNNGNRRGLECPEERDYYPYWSPSPWIDVAYLTDHVEHCPMVEEGSQNTNAVYKCTGLINNDEDSFITADECTAADGTWTQYPAKNLPAPECGQVEWSRVNHHGNGKEDPLPMNYTWTLPTYSELASYGAKVYGAGTSYEGFKCAFRLRYNISTDDYDGFNTTAEDNDILYNNPDVSIGDPDFQGLQLAINTAQFGRTFQDRSHTFYVLKRPTQFSNSRIVNLNVRGKRGNIVQTYPQQEYDFVPNDLTVSTDDFVHVQWTGSNTHNNGPNGGDGQTGDAGQGTTGTDRNNMVITPDEGGNFPIPLDKAQWDTENMWKHTDCYNLDGTAITNWEDCAVIMATSGYGRTTTAGFADMSAQLNNAPASLIGGVMMKINDPNTYYYMSSRNNDFSNRSQKGKIKVEA